MRTKGQSMLEFALILPILFFLVIGLFDLGRAVLYYSTLNTAVREGTRFAIVQPKNTSEATIKTHVRKYLFAIKDMQNIPDSDIVVTYINLTSNDPKIQISITYKYVPITPGIKQLVGNGGITIHAQSIMRLTPWANRT
jgi:Flp pilus assembly protein TadG